MPDKIRPSEVSEVLLQQLKGINTSIQFDEVGAVLQVFMDCSMPRPMNYWNLKTE